MNETQCQKLAGDFLEALKKSETVRDRWVAICESSEWQSLPALIKETTGSPQQPTSDDLSKMRDYGRRQLRSELDELKELDERIETQYVWNGMDNGGHGGGGHPGG
jgi:hypothetical protein